MPLTPTDLPDPVVPPHEEVRRSGEVSHDRSALDVLAEHDGQRHLGVAELVGGEELAQVDGEPVLGRDLDADDALPGDGGDDAHGRGAQAHGEVVGEVGDLADGDALLRQELERGDHGADADVLHLAGDLERGEGLLDAHGHLAQVLGVERGLLRRDGIEERQLGQQERPLGLADDAAVVAHLGVEVGGAAHGGPDDGLLGEPHASAVLLGRRHEGAVGDGLARGQRRGGLLELDGRAGGPDLAHGGGRGRAVLELGVLVVLVVEPGDRVPRGVGGPGGLVALDPGPGAGARRGGPGGEVGEHPEDLLGRGLHLLGRDPLHLGEERGAAGDGGVDLARGEVVVVGVLEAGRRRAGVGAGDVVVFVAAAERAPHALEGPDGPAGCAAGGDAHLAAHDVRHLRGHPACLLPGAGRVRRRPGEHPLGHTHPARGDGAPADVEQQRDAHEGGAREPEPRPGRPHGGPQAPGEPRTHHAAGREGVSRPEDELGEAEEGDVQRPGGGEPPEPRRRPTGEREHAGDHAEERRPGAVPDGLVQRVGEQGPDRATGVGDLAVTRVEPGGVGGAPSDERHDGERAGEQPSEEDDLPMVITDDGGHAVEDGRLAAGRGGPGHGGLPRCPGDSITSVDVSRTPLVFYMRDSVGPSTRPPNGRRHRPVGRWRRGHLRDRSGAAQYRNVAPSPSATSLYSMSSEVEVRVRYPMSPWTLTYSAGTHATPPLMTLTRSDRSTAPS
jgi:hypothetical protein